MHPNCELWSSLISQLTWKTSKGQIHLRFTATSAREKRKSKNVRLGVFPQRMGESDPELEKWRIGDNPQGFEDIDAKVSHISTVAHMQSSYPCFISIQTDKKHFPKKLGGFSRTMVNYIMFRSNENIVKNLSFLL